MFGGLCTWDDMMACILNDVEKDDLGSNPFCNSDILPL